MYFWQGERIRLRAVEPSDGSFFSRLNEDTELVRNMDHIWTPTSAALTAAFAEEQSKNKFEKDTFVWIIQDQQGEAVGTIDTHDCKRREGTFSYGISVAAEHRRRGYASEAIRLVLKYYFEELRYQKVTTNVHSDNPASIALHEHLGFKKEGVLRRMVYSHGEFFDDIMYGMTGEEFREKNRDH